MRKKQKKVQKIVSRLVRIVGDELKEFRIEYGNNWDSENVHCNNFEQAYEYAKFHSSIKLSAPADESFISKIEDLGSAKVILPTADVK